MKATIHDQPLVTVCKKYQEKVLSSVSLKKNSFYSLSGQAIYSLAQWFLLVFIAHLTNVSNLGSFSLGLSMSAPIVMLFSFRLNLILASDVGEEYSFIEYLTIRVLTMFLAFLSIVITAFIFYHNPRFLGVVLFLGLAKCCEGVSEMFLTLTQLKQNTRYIFISLFLRGLLTLTLMSLILYFTGSLLLASLGYFLIRMLILYCYDSRILFWLGKGSNVLSALGDTFYRLIKEPIKYNYLLCFFKMGFPLSVIAVLDSVNTNIPGYFTAYYLGHGALGYYSALSYILTGSIVLMGMFLLPIIPVLTRHYQKNNLSEFYSLFIRVIAFIVIVSILGMAAVIFFGGWFLHSVFNSQFEVYHDVFTWLILAAVFNYLALLFVYLLTAMRKIQIQVVCFSMTILVALLSSILLIPKYGLQGAAWAAVLYSATLLSTTALAIVSQIYRHHFMPEIS